MCAVGWCLTAGATCAGFRSAMGAPPSAGRGSKKAFHPRNFPGRKACNCLSRYHPHWPKTARSVTETAQHQKRKNNARFPSAVSGVPARVYWAALRLFKRVLRAVLRSNESAAFPASAALCKIRDWRYSSRHGLARIIQACSPVCQAGYSKKTVAARWLLAEKRFFACDATKSAAQTSYRADSPFAMRALTGSPRVCYNRGREKPPDAS